MYDTSTLVAFFELSNFTDHPRAPREAHEGLELGVNELLEVVVRIQGGVVGRVMTHQVLAHL